MAPVCNVYLGSPIQSNHRDWLLVAGFSYSSDDLPFSKEAWLSL